MNRLDWAILLCAVLCVSLLWAAPPAPALPNPPEFDSPVIILESTWQRDNYAVTTWFYVDPQMIQGVYGPYDHYVYGELQEQMKVAFRNTYSFPTCWLPDLGSADENRTLWGDAYARFADARDNGLINGPTSFSTFLRH